MWINCPLAVIFPGPISRNKISDPVPTSGAGPGEEDAAALDTGAAGCANQECLVQGTEYGQERRNTEPIDKYLRTFGEQVPVFYKTCGMVTCAICQRLFAKKTGLSVHLRSAHAKPYHAANVLTLREQHWNYETLSELDRI